MNIGFIGLGTMGGSTAKNIVKKGPEKVIMFDTSQVCRERFKAEGYTVVESYKDFAEVEVIFLCVPNTEIVKDILFGENNLKSVLHAGQIIVDLSTIKYNATLEIKDKLSSIGVDFLDSPISGMAARAVTGELAVMVGGSEEIFAKVKPILERFGTNIQYMGGTGSGQLTKLINQLLFDINLAGMAEIMPFAVKMGLDPEKVTSIVNTGTGRSFATEQLLPKILKGIFAGGYPMAKAYKDLVSAAEIMASNNLTLPVLSAAMGTYQMALLKGYGDADKGIMIKVFEELFGVEFRAGGK